MEAATATTEQTGALAQGMDRAVDPRIGLGLLRDQDLASYRRMTDRIAEGDSVLFVGAGPSTPLCGSWDGLVSELLTRARLVRRRERPFDTVDRCRKALGERSYGEVLLHRFELAGRRRAEGIHVSMALAPFDSYVTTNFDRCIEEGFATALRQHGSVHAYPNSISAADIGRKSIFHLHGTIAAGQDPSAIRVVLGEEEYGKAYGPDGDLADFWDQLLVRSQRTVVFCGYSFDDHSVVFESLRRGVARIRTRIEKAGEEIGEMSPRVHYVLLHVPTFPDLTYWAANVGERELQLSEAVSGCDPVVRFVPVFYADSDADDPDGSHKYLTDIFHDIARGKASAIRGPSEEQEYPSAAHP